MENKVASAFKIVAVLIFIVGVLWAIVGLANQDPFWYYVFFTALFSGLLNYGIGEGLQLLTDIKMELINKNKVKSDTTSESLVDRFAKGGKL